MRVGMILATGLVLAGCQITPVGRAPVSKPKPVASTPSSSAGLSAKSFVAVVEQMEPVAERICRQQAPRANCDFNIVVDTRKGQPPNAYQTVDKQGRPILAFTAALIAKAQNKDELAFVMGHEAAHHILGHLGRTKSSATAGAVLGGILASLAGGNAGAIDTASDLGAAVGARAFSKDLELEADSLGTKIAFRAGFDPERGAKFFTRIPDPGDRFLGSHPPNASRIKTVRNTLAGLK